MTVKGDVVGAVAAGLVLFDAWGCGRALTYFHVDLPLKPELTSRAQRVHFYCRPIKNPLGTPRHSLFSDRFRFDDDHDRIPLHRCLTMRYSRLALAAALGALASPETACAFQHNPNAKRSVAATAAAAVGSSSSTSFASIVDDRQRRSKNLPSLVWGQRRRAAPLLFSTAAPAETAEAASDAKETYEFTVRQPCYRHLA